MPYVHDYDLRVNGKRVAARWWMERGEGTPRVHQLDDHSCGFLAALAVARQLRPELSIRDVLNAVRPGRSHGIDTKPLISALNRIGIQTRYHKSGIGWAKLTRMMDRGRPLIVSVLPLDWEYDHWTVVREVGGLISRRVYLSNIWGCDGLTKKGALLWSDFRAIWYDPGQGIECW